MRTFTVSLCAYFTQVVYVVVGVDCWLWLVGLRIVLHLCLYVRLGGRLLLVSVCDLVAVGFCVYRLVALDCISCFKVVDDIIMLFLRLDFIVKRSVVIGN